MEAGVKNHEISQDRHKKMKLGFMMQDTGYKFRHASCILYLQLFSREINPFRVCGDVGRAHDV